MPFGRCRVKVDLKKELASYRAKRGAFEIIDVPPLRYLMVDGSGDPNTQEFTDAITTLYSVAYPLKFISKREQGRDYVVMPLEALWWAEDMATFSVDLDKSRWEWTAMILTPDWITDDEFERARSAVATTAIGRLRLDALEEGTCVQTLHVGAFDEEGPVLDRMHREFIPSHGLRMTGRHHEIYLSDLRRADPAKLRTILRQPVGDAAS
jgi:hypothetical protein